MRLLVVEDDTDVREFIVKALKEAGHAVDSAEDGKEGLFLATTETYDVLILDRMLPHVDGLTVLKTIRGVGNDTPVLILSALGKVDERVSGLKAGGDDYLVKPFAVSELLARVEVLQKRASTGKSDPKDLELTVGDLHVNLLSRRVERAGELISLQAREYALLEFLLRQKGKVVTRKMLLESVWDYHFDPQTNVIDVHISRLRKKLGDEEGLLIRTIRGAGYIVEDV